MQSWPSLTYTERLWVHRDPLASRRSQRKNRGTFQVPHVPYISEAPVRLSVDVLASASAASVAMTRFDHEQASFAHFPFATVLLRGESVTSSQIENLTVNARKLSLAALGAPVGGNAELVARNVSAMKAAIDVAHELSIDALLTMHEELTAGVQDDAGELRKEWVWIGGESPVTARYVAPAWEDVPGLLEDLVVFLGRRDLDPTVQAALAHAQFETIHPFTDGNGRTGRALISSLLKARGVTQHVVVPLSSGLLYDLEGYVSALEAYRRGDIEPIILCFVDAIESSLANTRLLAQDIEQFYEQILASRPRVTEAVRKVARFCCSEPAFTAGMLEEHAGVARSTTYRIIDSLVETGILRREQKVRGQNAWSAPALTEALDAFAQRAGRRRFV